MVLPRKNKLSPPKHAKTKLQNYQIKHNQTIYVSYPPKTVLFPTPNHFSLRGKVFFNLPCVGRPHQPSDWLWEQPSWKSRNAATRGESQGPIGSNVVFEVPVGIKNGWKKTLFIAEDLKKYQNKVLDGL